MKDCVILFYAPWCGYCKKFKPLWNHICDTLHVDKFSYNMDNGPVPKEFQHLGIKTVPKIVTVKHGEIKVWEKQLNEDTLKQLQDFFR
jgi:thiol-disulfide isomerase/thioredoxin